MQYNIYLDQFLELVATRTVLSKKLDEMESTQGWYKKFDSNAAVTAIGNAKKLMVKFMDEIDSLQEKIFKQESKISGIREKSRPGWNPKYWISMERTALRVELSNQISELTQLQNRLDGLRKKNKIQSDTSARFEADLKMYYAHNPVEFSARINNLKLEQRTRSYEMEAWLQERGLS